MSTHHTHPLLGRYARSHLLAPYSEILDPPLTITMTSDFIIHPCDPTVVICYLIRPCDIAVCITYLISHSYSLTYNLRIFEFGCIINTELPSCDDIIRRTSLGFPSWCSDSTGPTDSCFQAPAVKSSLMYRGLYQHTRVFFYMYHKMKYLNQMP